jgi:leader peptidase (prepilin peptidase)/N-methyltransferase
MLLLYALFGLFVGAILNVLADVMPQRARFKAPICTYCDRTHEPVAWLATTGFLMAQGRCSHCGASLPLRRVLVELTTAMAFGFLYNRYGFTGHMLLLSIYMALFILITVIDLEHRLVLNRVIGPAILLALVAGPFTPHLNWKQMLVGGLVGFGLFYLAALLYPGGMGAGDVKLAAFVGLITGFPSVLVALVVTIFAGGIISLLLILTRIRSRRDYIPYGPFLVIGGVFALFWGRPIMNSYLDLDQPAESAQVLPAPEYTRGHRGFVSLLDVEKRTVYATAEVAVRHDDGAEPQNLDYSSSSSSQSASKSQSSASSSVSLIQSQSSKAARAAPATSVSGSSVSSCRRV